MVLVQTALSESELISGPPSPPICLLSDGMITFNGLNVFQWKSIHFLPERKWCTL